MPKSFSISADSIAEETARVGGDLEQFDISRVIKLDDLELREMGPSDVHMRILAASAEHNVDHAATADTVNIVEMRGGKTYPGNSAVGEVLEVGRDVTRFKPGDVVITHCNADPDEYGYPQRIWAYDAEDSVGWYGEEAVVGDWQLIPAPLECGLNLWEIAALPLRAPTAYHLWHPPVSRTSLPANDQLLAEAEKTGATTCALGVSQYLGSSPPGATALSLWVP